MQLALFIVGVFVFYLLINLARLRKNRLHPQYMRHEVPKTTLWLCGFILLTLAIAWLANLSNIHALGLVYIMAGFQLIVALVTVASTRRHLRTIRPVALTENYSEKQLPTLTVCIPARNETEELDACLQSLVASNYPKLEILVLDDCSQNKRTPEIIRGFAQAGVRFIAGQAPPDSWLAKNYAYKQMAESANGDVLLFCGVDCRFEADSLTNLVRLLLQKKKTMASLLPRNVLNSSWNLQPMLVQPARYAWELALPRRLLNRPPVLSTCWLIKRAALDKAGGFEAVSRKPVPESYFARQTAKLNDGYTFIQASSEIGLTSSKQFSEQQSTAVRTRYPQLHRRPELVVLVSLAEFTFLVWPLFMTIISALVGFWWLTLISGLAFVLQSYVYGKIVDLTYRKFIIGGYLMMQLAALYDIGLLNYSMWQYEFGEVTWKGRNVCLPVMQVLPELPKPS